MFFVSEKKFLIKKITRFVLGVLRKRVKNNFFFLLKHPYLGNL